MKSTLIAQRIQSRMKQLGKNPSSVALEAGLGRSSVRDILLGRAENPRLDTLRKLTGPLECTLDFLTGETDDPKESTGSTYWGDEIFIDPLFAQVQAGIFRQLENFGSEQWPLRLDYASVAILAPDPRLEDWSVKLVQMADDSQEGIHILKNDVLTVAFPPDRHWISLSSGMLVLCRQRFDEPQIEELSVRQVVLKADGIHLTTNSTRNLPSIVIDPRTMEFAARNETDQLQANMYVTDTKTVMILGVIARAMRQFELPDIEEISYTPT